LTETFEERDVFLPVIFQLSVTDKVGDARKQNFDVVDINFLGQSLTEHGNRISVAIPKLRIAWLTRFVR